MPHSFRKPIPMKLTTPKVTSRFDGTLQKIFPTDIRKRVYTWPIITAYKETTAQPRCSTRYEENFIGVLWLTTSSIRK